MQTQSFNKYIEPSFSSLGFPRVKFPTKVLPKEAPVGHFVSIETYFNIRFFMFFIYLYKS